MCRYHNFVSLRDISFNNEYSLLDSVPQHCKEVSNVTGIYRNTCVFNTKLGIILFPELATCVATDFLPVRQQSYRPIKRASFSRLKCRKPSKEPHCVRKFFASIFKRQLRSKLTPNLLYTLDVGYSLMLIGTLFYFIMMLLSSERLK